MFGAFGTPDHHHAIRIIHRTLGAGVNVIDAADGYSGDESEEIVGKAHGPDRRCWPAGCLQRHGGERALVVGVDGTHDAPADLA
jgi:Aldo/keto reductase family